jgi:uncharacterized membrane protein YdjX (TVP38/TMEM64 family)
MKKTTECNAIASPGPFVDDSAVHDPGSRPIFRILLSAVFVTVLVLSGSWFLTLPIDSWFARVNVWLSAGDYRALCVALSLVLMIVAAFTPFPAESVALVNGMVFGPVVGAILTWAGAMSGALLAYAMSRWAAEPIRPAWKYDKSQHQLSRWLSQKGPGMFLVARLIPLVPFFLLNLGAGMVAMPWRRYVLLTGLGILPLSIALAVIGSGLPPLK